MKNCRFLILIALAPILISMTGCNPPSGSEVTAPNPPAFSVAKLSGYYAVDLGSAIAAPSRINNLNSSNQLESYTIKTQQDSTTTYTDYDGSSNLEIGHQIFQVDGSGNLISQTERQTASTFDGSGNPIQLINDTSVTYDSDGRPLIMENKSTNTSGVVVSHERKVFSYPGGAGPQKRIQSYNLLPSQTLLTDFTFTTDLTNRTIQQSPTGGGNSIEMHYHFAHGNQLYVLMMPKFLGGILPAGYTVQHNVTQSDNVHHSTITVTNASNQLYAKEIVEGVFVQYLAGGKLQDENFQIQKREFSLYDSSGSVIYRILEEQTFNGAFIKTSSYTKEEDLLLNQTTEVRESCSLDATQINLVSCSTPDGVSNHSY